MSQTTSNASELSNRKGGDVEGEDEGPPVEDHLESRFLAGLLGEAEQPTSTLFNSNAEGGKQKERSSPTWTG